MKFGIHLMPFETPFPTLLEDAREGARLGYDSVWLGENHSSPASYPSPLLPLAWFSGALERPSFGTSVLALPMYHPVRLAEEAALLDILSGGRLVLGVGLGGTKFREEYGAYGLDPKGRLPRAREQLQVMRALWSGETLQHHGQFYDLTGAHLAFPPVQRGGPPIWIGGRTAIGARFAAEGDAFLLGPSVPIAGLRQLYPIYDETAARRGAPPKARPLMRETTIGLTEEESHRDDAIVTEYFTRSYLKAASIRSLHDPDLGRLPENTFIRGDPGRCIDGIEFYRREFAIDHVILRFRFSGMSDEKVRMKMRLFADKIFPEFR